MFEVFNSPSYLELEVARLGGEAVRMKDNIGLIAREIQQGNCKDLMSVYGYPDLSDELSGSDAFELNRFLEELATQAKGYVTAYLRLGVRDSFAPPVNPASAVLIDVGEIVSVNLARNYDDIYRSYRKQLRYELRQPQNFTFEHSSDIEAFHDIYTHNMKRVQARDEYLFEFDYLMGLCSIDGVELRMAYDDEGPVAGAVLIKHKETLFYHLGATAERALRVSPMKYLLNEIIRENACGPFAELVLGGGVGGSSDKLLQFKRGFSKDTFMVRALRAVLDTDRYKELAGAEAAGNLSEGYFPAYRNPNRKV